MLVDQDRNEFVLTPIMGDPIKPDRCVDFSILSSARSLEFENAYWVSSSGENEQVRIEDVRLVLITPRRSLLALAATAAGGGIFLLGVVAAFLATPKFAPPVPPSDVSVPFTNSDIEPRLARAIDAVPPVSYSGGFPYKRFTKPSDELASAVARKMRSYAAEYNKPGTLLLGKGSTPVQLVIKTNENQETASYFKDFEGEIAEATVLVARDLSADLTGPSDRLQITLRGDKMRTILSPAPITWIWDVKPLKPGPAQVTLEVTSYIKKGKDTEPVPVRVLQDTWFVEAQGMEWVKCQVEQIEPIKAFIFSIVAAVVAVLAWFGIRGWGNSKPDYET